MINSLKGNNVGLLLRDGNGFCGATTIFGIIHDYFDGTTAGKIFMEQFCPSIHFFFRSISEVIILYFYIWVYNSFFLSFRVSLTISLYPLLYFFGGI